MTAPDLTAMLQDTLADEGWCCDPYGHEDGPPATGECSECDRLRGDTATALAATVRNWLGGVEVRNEVEAHIGDENNVNGIHWDFFPDPNSAIHDIATGALALVQQIGDGQ